MVRDRTAAYMVRAATTGAFNYAHADPYSRQWRLRHLLVLRDVVRQYDEKLLTVAHEHWLAYVTHSNLEADSWKNVKSQAADTFRALRASIFPWEPDEETKPKQDTINGKYGDLIAQYRALIASENKEKAAEPPAE